MGGLLPSAEQGWKQTLSGNNWAGVCLGASAAEGCLPHTDAPTPLTPSLLHAPVLSAVWEKSE